MTSSPHGPYDQGFTRHTMVGTEGSQAARWSQSHKTDRSPDCTLQLECMKSESLVIAGQHTAVNTFPGLVHTARHTMGVGDTRSKDNEFVLIFCSLQRIKNLSQEKRKQTQYLGDDCIDLILKHKRQG